MADGEDSKKRPLSLAQRVAAAPRGQPQTTSQATAGEAMGLMIEQLDRSKRLFDNKAKEAESERLKYEQMRIMYEQRQSDLDARETELAAKRSKLDRREAILITREEKIGTLEATVAKLEAQNTQANRGAAEVSGTIGDPYVKLHDIQAKHAEEVARINQDYEAQLAQKDDAILQTQIRVQGEIERKYTGPEGIYTLAAAKIDKLEKLLAARSPAPVDSLNRTLTGMPIPVPPEEQAAMLLAQERPTKQPAAPKEDPGAQIESIIITETPEDFYKKLAKYAKDTNTTDRKKRYSEIVKAMQKQGIESRTATNIVMDAIQAEVLEEKAYEHIVEEGEKVDKMLASLRREVNAFESQKERLEALERREGTVKQQQAENLNLADALDRKEAALIAKQAEVKEMSEVITLAESAFKALNKGIEEMIVDSHNRVKDYKGRVASLVSGPRSIGATGAALILLPAYAHKLLAEPRDPDLVSMIADEKSPRLYFTAGEEGNAPMAQKLAETVPENEVYHISKQDDGTHYVAARVRTEGGTALANFAAWGIPGAASGELTEEQKVHLRGAANSIMRNAVMPDYRGLHLYMVKLKDMLRAVEQNFAMIKASANYEPSE